MVEPAAIRYDYDGYGYSYADSGNGSDWASRKYGEVQEFLYEKDELVKELALFAKNWLEDWGMDLQETSDAYREAVVTGKMNNRNIKPELAKAFAKEFNFRADSVYDCGEILYRDIMEKFNVPG